MKLLTVRCLLVLVYLSAYVLTASAETPAASIDIPHAIFNYMERPEPEFRWEKIGEQKFAGLGVAQHLKLTSQTWQNITWQHDLMVYEPADLKISDHMLLFVTGGAIGKAPKEGDIQQGLLLAKLCGTGSPQSTRCRISRCWGIASRTT